MSDANALKAEANKAFSAKDYTTASRLYSEAIALDPSNHVLFSNRSASKSGLKDYQGALEDAEKASRSLQLCIEILPSFAKGHARKGAALHGLRQYPEAVIAYEEGLQADPSNDVLKRGLEEVKKAMEADENGPFGGGDMGLGRMFNDPGLIKKLETNPKTRDAMLDPGFRKKVEALQKGGQADLQGMMGDPRMLSVLGVAMGIDIDAMERPEGSNEMPPGMGGSSAGESRSFEPEAEAPKPTPKPAAKPAPAPTPAPEPKEEPMEVDDEEAQAKAVANEEKAKGNTAYKARKFEEAIEHYSKAWDTWPKDVTFLTNLSAVYFEQGEYAKTIETCEKAIEEGRDLRADYKLFAKAFGRVGSAYLKQNDLENAIKFFQKSLTEHRTPDILTKLRETEKAKAEADKQAYIDPAKAEEAREAGNTEFKAGKFADAVKHYTEAIKRLPTDPRALNNRAAAYTKLLAMPEALKDAEAAIKIDPKFIKAYIRKALTQQAMKEHASAIETLQKGTDADVEKKHTRELESTMQNVMMEMQQQRSGETDEQTYQRAMRDPEVQEIMADPLMRQILADSQQDPRALMDHMKNPMIAAKVQKLINAGIIKTR